MNIESWLTTFKDAWINHDIDNVLSLFADDVEYWETPSRLLGSYEELRSEWLGVVSQRNIRLTTSVYSSTHYKHAVIWNLIYDDAMNETHTWSGTYLLTLNDDGLCTYFHHTGEKMKPRDPALS